MRTTKKVIIILIFVFILRTLSSCIFNCNCSNDVLYFDFNKIELTNLDNSQTYAVSTQSDTMINKAVAFEVRIFNDELSAHNYCPQKLFAYNSAYAWSCDCSPLLLPNNGIEKISIKTVFDINTQIKSGSEITNRFLTKNNQTDELYIPTNEIHSKKNTETYYHSAEEKFNLYLKDEVKNNKAQFIINVYLKNDTILSDTTNILTIKE